MKSIIAATFVALFLLLFQTAADAGPRPTHSSPLEAPSGKVAVEVGSPDATMNVFTGKPALDQPSEVSVPAGVTGGGDNFGTATVIPALPYTDGGTTQGFLNDYNPPCAPIGAPDVVYRFTTSENTCVTISLCGSSYDTVLHLYEDTPANLIACNDDYCAPSLQQSKLVSVQLAAGHNYYIVVDGYECNFLNCSSGPYTLSVTTDCPPPCAVTCLPGAIDEGEPIACNLEGTNEGCNMTVPGFTDIPCSAETVTVCGRYGSRADALTRDTDWYRIVLPEPKHVTVCVNGEATTILQILDLANGCTGYVSLASTATEPCQEACLEANLGAGIYAVVVASIFATDIPCGTPYTMTAHCEPFPLHCNDANGNGAAVGEAFVMTGIVTASFPTGASQRFYIQDASYGVNVFGIAGTLVGLGDYVRMTGSMLQFSGLAEITNPGTITQLSIGNAQPQPIVLTPSQVNGSFHPDNCEPDESRLVRVENVTIVSSTGAPLPPGSVFTANTNYGVRAEDMSLAAMRIVQSSNSFGVLNPLVGTTIPEVPVNATGVLSQFDSSVPYTSGYQLLPRKPEDIVLWEPSAVEPGLGTTLALRSPYPNPSRGTITFRIDLRESGPIDAAVFDVAGRRVATVDLKSFPAGTHVLHWNGLSTTGAAVPSGVYFVRVEAGGRTMSHEFVVTR